MKTKPEKHGFIWLDVARALAAVAVLLGHLRAYIFRDSVESNHLTPLWKAFYFFTSIQHQAVVVFFVLSGFLITRSISEDASSGRWSWSRYGFKRLSRLWIVLVPALILTVVWDQLGIHTTGSTLYSGGLNAINHSTPFGSLSFSGWTFLGNVAFLQGIAVPAFGTDTPLWSLADEFWYYIAFPLFFFAGRSGTRVGTRLLYLGAGFAVCLFLVPAQRYLGLVWLLGYAAYLVYRSRSRARATAPKRLATVAALGFAVIVLFSKLIKIDDVLQDIITGLSFAFLVVQVAGLGAPAFVARPARIVADFSFTLYVVHFPFLAYLTSALFANSRSEPSAASLLKFIVLFVITVAYAYGVSLVFEKNTSTVQAMLGRITWQPKHRRSPSTVAVRQE